MGWNEAVLSVGELECKQLGILQLELQAHGHSRKSGNVLFVTVPHDDLAQPVGRDRQALGRPETADGLTLRVQDDNLDIALW